MNSRPKRKIDDQQKHCSKRVKFDHGEGGMKGEQGMGLAAKWTEEEKDEMIAISISETDTETLFFLPSLKLPSDQKEEEDVMATRNHDAMMTRSAQTFNNSQREKGVQCTKIEQVDVECAASVWEIFDAMHADEELQKSRSGVILEQHLDDIMSMQTSGTSTGTSSRMGWTTSAGQSMTGMRSHVDKRSTFAQSMVSLAKEEQDNKWTKLPSFRRCLRLMECSLVQNAMHEKQMLYRYHHRAVRALEEKDKALMMSLRFPLRESSEEETKGEQPSSSVETRRLIPLWSFRCQETEGCNVTCMEWNHINSDLLAVGYGDVRFGNLSPGMILLWSPKNPKYPEKLIRTTSSVTSLHFCSDLPHLLAVGLFNGSVAVYDMRESCEQAAVESTHAAGKHSEPVWGVRWVQTGIGESGQHIVSISTDGTVLQWAMKKGLVPHPLMRLKRVPNLAHIQDKYVEGISRDASGLCFDFPINDNTQYFAGTEDGLIHKCSVSYNEQTLENYYGHSGPVYKVRCSPFVDDAFLSCSADWTAALWVQKKNRPILTFQSGQDYIADIRWAETNSCVFSTVSQDGRIEVWDIEERPSEPVLRLTASKSLNAVLFSNVTPVLLTGGHDGSVDAYYVHGIRLHAESMLSHDQQAARLYEAISKNASSEHVVPSKDPKSRLTVNPHIGGKGRERTSPNNRRFRERSRSTSKRESISEN